MLENNEKQQKIKEFIDSQETAEIKITIDDTPLHKRKQLLDQITVKNSEHIKHVNSKLEILKKVQKESENDKIVKLYQEMKRKERVVKELKARNRRVLK